MLYYEAKSAVNRPWNRTFLGFALRSVPGLPRAIAANALRRFKERIREATRDRFWSDLLKAAQFSESIARSILDPTPKRRRPQADAAPTPNPCQLFAGATPCRFEPFQ
jgi:hypothetical protein